MRNYTIFQRFGKRFLLPQPLYATATLYREDDILLYTKNPLHLQGVFIIKFADKEKI